MTKKVSVVMCTYNGEKYLREQIDSILGQTYPIYELLIVDDCSVDSTVEIINVYKEKYSNIVFYQNEERLGVHLNFAKAFYLAQGDYISVSDQDDIWLLNKIERLIEKIDDCIMVASNSYMFGNVQGKIFKKQLNTSSIALLMKNGIVGHTVLFSKKILPEDFSIWENRYITYDALLGFIASANGGNVYFLNECLTKWRRHENTLSKQGKTKGSRGGIKGYVEAFLSLWNKQQRILLRNYYSTIVPLYKQSKLYPFVYYLSIPSVCNLFKCCILCLKRVRELEMGENNFFVCSLRALFVPLFKCRDIKERY